MLLKTQTEHIYLLHSKRISHQLFAFLCSDVLPGLPIESQLLHTAEGKFLILHTLVTCCCLTLSKHLRETVSWSRAATQLMLRTSRDTTQAATYLRVHT